MSAERYRVCVKSAGLSRGLLAACVAMLAVSISASGDEPVPMELDLTDRAVCDIYRKNPDSLLENRMSLQVAQGAKVPEAEEQEWSGDDFEDPMTPMGRLIEDVLRHLWKYDVNRVLYPRFDDPEDVQDIPRSFRIRFLEILDRGFYLTKLDLDHDGTDEIILYMSSGRPMAMQAPLVLESPTGPVNDEATRRLLRPGLPVVTPQGYGPSMVRFRRPGPLTVPLSDEFEGVTVSAFSMSGHIYLDVYWEVYAGPIPRVADRKIRVFRMDGRQPKKVCEILNAPFTVWWEEQPASAQ